MQRMAHIAMLVWVAFFFVLYLPGHQRGSITLPDTGRAGAAIACPLCPTTPRDGTTNDPQPTPTRGTCCAICQFMGTLSSPPDICFDPPAVRLLDILEPLRTAQLCDLSTPQAYRGRGPPLV